MHAWLAQFLIKNTVFVIADGITVSSIKWPYSKKLTWSSDIYSQYFAFSSNFFLLFSHFRATCCLCETTNYMLIFSPGLVPTWNESSQGLVVLISVPVGLPPVGVILADDVEDVSLLEGQAQLPTWHEGVIRGVVVKVSPYVHLRTGFTTSRLALHACRQAISCRHAHTHIIRDLPQSVCVGQV